MLHRSGFPVLILINLIVTSTMGQILGDKDLITLPLLKDFQAMRASSSALDWRDGNDDTRGIHPGATLTLAELSGPGVITHIWFTIAHPARYYSRLLTLRIHWDGEEHPSVECPVGDFFGIGHGEDRSFQSMPIRVSAQGKARNCYWPMPFAKAARITVTNESDQPCYSFYWYIDWQKHSSLPANSAYFHAMYRQEYPCVMGRNYLLADIRGHGHYVGTVQSVYLISDGWYGEGDDFFYIDGEQEPRLKGTGTEDYFGDAWGFREFDGPFYGVPLWEGMRAGDRGTAYRFHIPDPIPFTSSLRVEIEHKGSQHYADGTWTGYIERDDLMSSVVFWYQTEPHKPWPALPSGPERLPFHEELLVAGGESVDVCRHSEHAVQAQELGGIVTCGKHLFFTPEDDQAWLQIPFTTEGTRTLSLWGKMVSSWDYGVYRVLIDGQQLGIVDAHSASVTPKTYNWGVHEMSAGEHILRLECIGKSSASAGYFLGFDALVARIPAYARPPGKDLRDLQAPRQ